MSRHSPLALVSGAARSGARAVRVVSTIVAVAAILFALAAACAWAAPAPATGASTAAAQYRRALAREKAARASHAPSVVSLRAIAKSYESIVRAHPTSGYADNALWQGAGVLALAFDRSGDIHDRDGAVRLLRWLAKSYPTSPFVRQVDGKIEALDAVPAARSTTAAADGAKTAGARSTAAAAASSSSTSSSRAADIASAAAARSASSAPATSAAGTAPYVAANAHAKSTEPPDDAIAAARSTTRADKPAGATRSTADARLAPSSSSSERAATTSPSASTSTTGRTATSRTLRPSAEGSAERAVSAPPDHAASAGSATSTARVESKSAASRAAAGSDGASGSAAPTAAAAPADNAAPVVERITHSRLPRGDRLTIELSREALSGASRAAHPDRILFDIYGASATSSLAASLGHLSGPLLTSVAIAPGPSNALRLALDLTGQPRYSSFRLYSPFRIVIDIESESPLPEPTASAAPRAAAGPAATPPASSDTPSAAPSAHPTPDASSPATAPSSPSSPSPRVTSPSTEKPASSSSSSPSATTPLSAMARGSAAGNPASSKSVSAAVTSHAGVHEPADASRAAAPPAIDPAPSAAAPTSNGDYSIARQLGLGISRIVIDPGHGGHDPGAQANGLTEAELVLDVSLRLEKLLTSQPGIDVVLTRRTDEFVPLEERTAIANRAGADLFLSIHANASPHRSATGIETFFLNLATNAQAEAVAARENATSAQTMGTLPQILKTIELNNKLAESRELATMVQASLVRRLSARRRPAKDLGVKQAPFVVLIGAQMPSVLAEISFLTNSADAKLLKQSSYRQRIAQALYDSLIKYQGSLKKVTTVAAR